MHVSKREETISCLKVVVVQIYPFDYFRYCRSSISNNTAGIFINKISHWSKFSPDNCLHNMLPNFQKQETDAVTVFFKSS